MAASLPSIYLNAWPDGWTENPGYRATFDRLVFQFGRERAVDIVRGQDFRTNADLRRWRQVGWSS